MDSIESIVSELKKVVNGDVDEVDLSMKCSPNEAAEFIENILKLDPQGEIETNGWQYDFWLHYKNPEGKKFCLSGGGWYGELFFGVREDK